MIRPKRPIALPKISTMRIFTKSAGFAASDRAAPDPTCWNRNAPRFRGVPSKEAPDLDLANTDAADKVGEPSGEASSEHGEASEVVVGEQLGVVCHRGWCVRLSKKAQLKLSDC